MNQVVNTLFPVFLVIGLGFLLAKRGLLTERVLHELNRLLFVVCLPALIVYSLATASDVPAGTGTILWVFSLSTIVTIGLGLWAGRALGLASRQIGTFVQGAFRGNLAYAGIPLILFALQGSPPELVASVMAQTVFVFAPAMLLYNVASVILLVRDREASLQQNFVSMSIKVIKNPLILASIAGCVLFALPFSLPRFVLNSFQLTGQMAAPAALLCVGGSMAYVSMEGRYRSACVASLLKVVFAPLCAWLMSFCFDLNETSRMVLLILSACPTAVASYIMAKELEGDEALASGAIIISTIASMPVLALIVGLN